MRNKTVKLLRTFREPEKQLKKLRHKLERGERGEVRRLRENDPSQYASFQEYMEIIAGVIETPTWARRDR